MASIPQHDRLDLDEQIARIEKMNFEMGKINAETRKLLSETRLLPINTILALTGALAAVFAAGVTLTKLFWH